MKAIVIISLMVSSSLFASPDLELASDLKESRVEAEKGTYPIVDDNEDDCDCSYPD